MEKISIELTREEAIQLAGLLGVTAGTGLSRQYYQICSELSESEEREADELSEKYEEKYDSITLFGTN